MKPHETTRRSFLASIPFFGSIFTAKSRWHRVSMNWSADDIRKHSIIAVNYCQHRELWNSTFIRYRAEREARELGSLE